MAVEPYCLVGNIAGTVSREACLHVVPRVNRPVSRITTGPTLAHPLGSHTAGATRVDRIRPVSGPAIALHTHQNRLPIGHRLIYVKFQVCEHARGTRQVHPRVVEEVLRINIVVQRDTVTLRSIVPERCYKLSRTAIF